MHAAPLGLLQNILSPGPTGHTMRKEKVRVTGKAFQEEERASAKEIVSRKTMSPDISQ